MIGINPSRLDGWMPIRVYADHGQPMVDWCHFGDRRFGEPFFAETVERRLRDPFALLFRHQTPLDELVTLQAASPGVPPAGFVFHTSRCGSTVLMQMLGALDGNVVLSEPSPVEDLLYARMFTADVDDEVWITWLRALISAIARPRAGTERRCFVKFDGWHALFLPLIRRAFPEVPWVFMYRHPVEVMASHRRNAGAQFIPGVFPSQLYGIAPAETNSMSADDYLARAVSAICEAALRHLDDGGLPLSYADLPEAGWTSVAAHFGLELSTSDVEAMRRATRQDVKRPGRAFRGDSVAKQASAPAEMRAAAERFALSSWSRLEAERDGRAGAVVVGTG